MRLPLGHVHSVDQAFLTSDRVRYRLEFAVVAAVEGNDVNHSFPCCVVGRQGQCYLDYRHGCCYDIWKF